MASSENFSRIRENVMHTDTLVIDEISMLSLKDFRQLELVCRIGRQKEEMFFGGLQVIASGDFFQLAPVPNLMYRESGEFCFTSPIWHAVFPHHLNLTEVVRQSEPTLIRAIHDTSTGNITEKTHRFLLSLSRPLPLDTPPVYLFANNYDAELCNAAKLAEFSGEKFTFHSEDTGKTKLLQRVWLHPFWH